MRVAALAFAVLAGLVASFILALGGLDVPGALAATPDRQAQILRFGLFLIGNIGFFGAALVLAAPLAGMVMLIFGAAAWVGAALFLHHTSDVVLIAPPSLLLVAAILALIAHLRRPRGAMGQALDAFIPPLQPAAGLTRRQEREPDAQDFDEMPATQVGAGFFGDHAPSQPARVDTGASLRAQPAAAEELDLVTSPLDDKWNPRKRRDPPPRQRPIFKDVEDEDEEESGLARFGRATAAILNFGLYAGLAAAAILVFWTLRNTDTLHPAVAKIEPPASSVAASSAVAAPSSSSEQVLAAIQPSSSAERVLSLPPLPLASSADEISSEESTSVAAGRGGVIVADDAFASSVAAGTEVIAPSAEPVALASTPEPASSESPSAEPLPSAEIGDLTLPVVAVVPLDPTLEMTAVRSGIKPPARKPAPPPTANTANNTGL